MERELLKNIASKLFFPVRNRFILFDLFRYAPNHKVILNYWNRTPNLGDAISPIVVNYMLEQKEISVNKEIKERKHLYAIGSNLTSGIQDCCVWGSGIANVKSCYRLEKRKLDIRLVRGPLTRIALQDYGYDVLELYGDPGILLPEIYNPTVKKRYKYGVIYHIADKEKNMLDDSDTVLYIDIHTDDYKVFVKQLKSTERIISSSLHGIILAEAYGIEAVLLKPPKDMTKYYDWYYSTKRYDFPIADSLSEAKKIKAAPIPDLKEMNYIIKETFPYDLYE